MKNCVKESFEEMPYNANQTVYQKYIVNVRNTHCIRQSSLSIVSM